jgi:uncharacterized protein
MQVRDIGMKVIVRQIKTEGMELDQTLPVESIGLTGEDSIRFIAPVQVKVAVNRIEDEVVAKIKADSRYESFCGRCLEGIDREWSTQFTLNFGIDGKDDFIEMDEDIRQELILNLPARVVCRENCRGLCLECGVNLNNEQCVCAEKAAKKVTVKI